MSETQKYTPEKLGTRRERFVRGFKKMFDTLHEWRSREQSTRDRSLEAAEQTAPGITGLALQLLSETSNGSGKTIVTIDPERPGARNDVSTRWQGRFEVRAGQKGYEDNGTVHLSSEDSVSFKVGAITETLRTLEVSVSKAKDGATETSLTVGTRVSPEAGVARIVNRRIVVGGDGQVQEVYMRRFENGHWNETPSGLDGFDDGAVGALLHSVYNASPRPGETSAER